MLVKIDDDVRRLQLESKIQINRLNEEISELANTGLSLEQTATNNTQKLPPIVNQARNSDHSYSVDGWYNSTTAGGNQTKECAEVYTHPKNPALAVLGSIDVGTDLLNSPGAGFAASGLPGEKIIVYGAGAAGGKLVTTILARNSADQLQLATNALTTVSNVLVRYKLQKLARTNSKNSGASVNSALKSDDHSNFATNIQDPKWDKTGGFVRIGSTNTLDYFFGTYDTNGTTWLPQGYGVEASRPMHVIVKLAKAHRGVKFRGHFFAGIYNNNDDVLDYLSGNAFSLSATVRGNPAATVSTKYQIIAKSDRGFTYFSNILTVANAPDNASFIPNNVDVILDWSPGVPSTLQYTVYRQQGAGNVEILEIVPNGQVRTRDINQADRIDTGSVNFPTATADNLLKAYMATLVNSLDELAVDGIDKWEQMRLLVPMASTVDMSEATELVLRLGLTEACSLEITDAVTNGTTTISCLSGFFESTKHAGKSCTIRDLHDPDNSLTTTVSSVTDANNLVLGAAPSWTSDANILEILEGEPHGLVLDLVGLSFADGEWSLHYDDTNKRPQLVSSQPSGSTQGPVGDPYQPPVYNGGGINCFIWHSFVTEFYSRQTLLANDIYEGMSLYNGTEFPSIVKKVKRAIEYRLWQIQTKSGLISPPVTLSHRFLRSINDAEIGNALKDFRPGENILCFAENKFILDTVESITPVDFPDGILVCSVELEKQLTNIYSLLFLLESFLSHNRKYDEYGEYGY